MCKRFEKIAEQAGKPCPFPSTVVEESIATALGELAESLTRASDMFSKALKDDG